MVSRARDTSPVYHPGATARAGLPGFLSCFRNDAWKSSYVNVDMFHVWATVGATMLVLIEGGDGVRRSIGIVAGVLAAVLAGCADPPQPAALRPSSETGPSGATTPTVTGSRDPVPSTAAPTIASDQLPSNVIVATVTADSAGPCYLDETDEGHPYALYGSGGRLARGQRVQVQIAPLTASVECGPGERALIVKLIS